jgi:hypothetical protein
MPRPDSERYELTAADKRDLTELVRQGSDLIFANQTGFEKHPPKNFAALAAGFTEYK